MSIATYISHRTVHYLRRVQAQLNQLHPAEEPQALVVSGFLPPSGDVIVFTGSFNPPTNAHLALMKQAQRFASGQRKMHLYAAISKHTVNKEKVERPLLLDRIYLLNMLLRRRLPHAGILLFNRGLYVEQAEAIRRSFPKVKRLFFLLGFDKIVQILDPRYYDDRDATLTELFNLAELLVAPRGNQDEHDLARLVHQPENERFARSIHPLPFSTAYRNVSSTSVRQRVEVEGEEIHEIPQEVRKFIRETCVYATALRKRNGAEIDYYGERVKMLNQILGMAPS